MAEAPRFGTSGLRGLADQLAGPVTRRYVAAFLQHLSADKQLLPGGPVFLGRDLRASSPAILADCCAAIAGRGYRPVDCGAVPTPALAALALGQGPAIMVTGSHIPQDRNGLKFYTPQGEITKEDEVDISRRVESTEPPEGSAPKAQSADALTPYLARYEGFLAPEHLSGRRYGIFRHSSVARDLLGPLLRQFGAETVEFGHSETFIAVDTEGLSAEIKEHLEQEAQRHGLDGIVSTDGDGDRPLITDAQGTALGGDLIGLVSALLLEPEVVVTPVSSNSAIDTGFGFEVVRTRIGSPYVIRAMQEKERTGSVLGFEANGGVLIGSTFRHGDAVLAPLPTRDAVLPILSVLGYAAQRALCLSELHDHLGLTCSLSGLVRGFSFEALHALMQELDEEGAALEALLDGLGRIVSVDRTDGVRCHLQSDAIVHLRASGNAPELRIYVEAGSDEAASALLAAVSKRARIMANQGPKAI